MSVGKLEAIWLKRAVGGPMDSQREATTLANVGLAGNANQGGKRQVTLIQREVWDKLMAQTGADLDPSTRRANLLVSGVELAETRGHTLQIGEVRVRIYGETRPCEQMDAAHDGLRTAMSDDWGGGAFGEVLDDGHIAVGDAVTWIDG